MKCCDLTAGKLRHTITISRKVSTPDGFGGFTVAWTSYSTPKAYIKAVSGYERMQADRLESGVNYRGYIRFRDDVRPSDKVTYNGKDFNIKAAYDMEERRRWLELDLVQGEAV